MSQYGRIAYVFSCATSALIKAMGMLAENQVRIFNDEEPPYREEHFETIIYEFNISPDDIVILMKK